MDKATAIKLLGGTPTSAALAIGGITSQAVSQWPDPLPPRIADRVQAALWRIEKGIPHPAASAEEPESTKAEH